jgi:hypothetical protein
MLMGREPQTGSISRRRFVQALGMLAAGGQSFFTSGSARAAVEAARDVLASAADWPAMSYRKLGRTGFDASRLVMGCGASLMFVSKDDLLNAAYEAGINVFDVGYRDYYRNAEENLAPFLQDKKVRDDIFLISKAPADVEVGDDDDVTVEQARQAARIWARRLDASLAGLRVDHVDAYYLMASYNPSLIRSEEIFRAFEHAREAGKVKHLGLSTHRNAQKVLQAAIETGWYDLAMIAITPGGWYDWESKAILAGSPPMTALRPVLDEARESGMGLVGMKAARHLAGLPILGWFDKPDAFNAFYDEKLLAAPFSAFQRSYAFVLAHGLDVVNADIQTLTQLRENVVATAESPRYLA